MKMRMVQSRAGMKVIMVVHHGLGPTGFIIQPRSSLVGWGRQKMRDERELHRFPSTHRVQSHVAVNCSVMNKTEAHSSLRGELTLNLLGTCSLGEGIPKA